MEDTPTEVNEDQDILELVTQARLIALKVPENERSIVFQETLRYLLSNLTYEESE